jgi:peptide/nickel transport system substrate-binding protein
MSRSKVSRREFMYMSGLGAASVLLSAVVARGEAAQGNKADEKQVIQLLDAKPLQEIPITPQNEAPELASLVQEGLLPPLVDRLPVNPLVLTPINTIGKYGGGMRLSQSWQGGFTEEMMYGHSPLRYIKDAQEIVPGMCESWTVNVNNTEWIIHFRQGLKWSDGQLCTVDDVLYWWEDLVKYPGGPDPVPDFGAAGGVLATFTKVDLYTLKITYAIPAPLTAKRLAMWVNGNIGPRWIAPKHYLMQFHPKYNPTYTDFTIHQEKILFRQNPACPSLDPWICTNYVQGVSVTWSRNPYYYAVDPVGHQLPYISGLFETLYTDHDSELVKIETGLVDFSMFTYNLRLADIPALQASQNLGNYEVRLWDTGSGTGMMYYWNYDHPDAKKRALFRTPKFKQAMSFALDRALIKASTYMGYGTVTTGTMSSKALEFNYNDEARTRYAAYRDAYSAYSPAQANALLDSIGVVDVEPKDGWREYPDGSPLEIRIDYPDPPTQDCLAVLQIAKQNWEAIGLKIVTNQVPGDMTTFWTSGQGEIRTDWEVSDGPDHLVYPSWVVPDEPERWAPLCGRTYQVRGTPLENTDCGIDPWSRVPPRYCAADPQYAGSTALTLQGLYDEAILETDELLRIQKVWQMDDLHLNQGPFFIGTVGDTPRIVIVSKNLENVPRKDQLFLGGFCNPWTVPYPAITNPETYSFNNLHISYLPFIQK